MWRDYSKSYIKNNRASSISIMAAALISTLFLSFLCSLFYNIWAYEIEQIVLEEGDWQGRITGDFKEGDIEKIQNFANVDRVVVYNMHRQAGTHARDKNISREQGTAVDVYFHDTRTIFEDMPLIVSSLGFEEASASYHITLLSRYFIHDPKDKEPPLLMAFFLAVLLIVSFSFVLIIKNSFAVSMGERMHQFGILSSIGATPKQIRICLIQEAAVLCGVPILLGYLIGVWACDGAMHAMNFMAREVEGRQEAVFSYHPFLFLVTMFASVSTVFLSVWIPARKLSKMTPLESIRRVNSFRLNRKRNSRILSRLFGMEGELAGNAWKAQRKVLRTSSLSLTLSFVGFTAVLCFFSLSDISTRHTYFERYQDVWDEMVTVKDTKIEDFNLTDVLRGLNGVENLIVYQKAKSQISVPKEWQSDELSALGGLSAVAGADVSESDGLWQVEAPMVIMDDEAFFDYCVQIGIDPQLNGTVILNQIWDSRNSNFRYKEYVPFVTENKKTIELQGIKGNSETIAVPVLGFTQQKPILREEYDNYTLVQFVPLSLWKNIKAGIEHVEADTYVRILSKDGMGLSELEEKISLCVANTYKIECENRIQEKISNDKMIRGYKLLVGSLCFLLALIGIANVFSNTLGFVHQRKREFAQYMSVGLTPQGMRNMFFIEALIIAGRPILITIPITVLLEVFVTKASHLKWSEVLQEFPVVPILCFSLVIFGFVALAYYIGSKRLLQSDLSEALQNDAIL